ncbi:TPA: hypothetical protein SAY52_006756 [Burkholderia cenocepacia]|uniref:hypothetical protein n=1 Tax=unclassified Burkholderia TaxID=2613784 RepID=UPI00158BF1E3|nr:MULTISPECIES: hypothetical protein [unclassified Burkholderia]HEF5872519.1 hypothetical protein [Burkholderia cenocepacia]HEF5876027.1 hypothetical protein [Burkholderia cenocepacia]
MAATPLERHGADDPIPRRILPKRPSSRAGPLASFKTLLAEIRAKRAWHYLERPELGYGQIAFRSIPRIRIRSPAHSMNGAG